MGKGSIQSLNNEKNKNEKKKNSSLMMHIQTLLEEEVICIQKC